MLLAAFLFGLIIASAIGPIAVLIMTTGLTRGRGAGLRAAAGAALADFIYACAALGFGAALTPLLGAHRAGLRLAASIVLIGFGLHMLRAMRASAAGTAAALAPSARPFLATLALTLVNPLTIIAFGGFTGQITGQITGNITPGMALACAAALACGSLSVASLLALGGAALGRVLTSPAHIHWLNLLSAAAIIGFGLAGLF